ncbi:hypothetical protein EON65_44965 [archaeon]|nr:MAG: hypothetical protein EON65_44965 [archaeon]
MVHTETGIKEEGKEKEMVTIEVGAGVGVTGTEIGIGIDERMRGGVMAERGTTVMAIEGRRGHGQGIEKGMEIGREVGRTRTGIEIRIETERETGIGIEIEGIETGQIETRTGIMTEIIEAINIAVGTSVPWYCTVPRHIYCNAVLVPTR